MKRDSPSGWWGALFLTLCKARHHFLGKPLYFKSYEYSTYQKITVKNEDTKRHFFTVSCLGHWPLPGLWAQTGRDSCHHQARLCPSPWLLLPGLQPSAASTATLRSLPVFSSFWRLSSGHFLDPRGGSSALRSHHSRGLPPRVRCAVCPLCPVSQGLLPWRGASIRTDARVHPAILYVDSFFVLSSFDVIASLYLGTELYPLVS